MGEDVRQAAESDYTPALVLHRIWGTASDVRADGFVNPSSVNYAPSEASALKKAAIRGEEAVSTLVADWRVISPGLPPAADPTQADVGTEGER